MNINGKRVLVTGADGFIGSHLVEALVSEGAIVRAFCYYNSFNSWGWLDGISKVRNQVIEVQSGDIRDFVSVKRAMMDVDIVFHLAALIAIPYSYVAPESYVETNVKGTLNVLQAARELGTSKVLVTSTSEVYGTARYVPIDEEHKRQGQSPYSATKIAADAMAESYYRSFGLPIVTVRPFNTYGPRQSSRAVIPTIITQILSGKGIIRLGSLHPTRDLVFVSDTVSGFVEIAKSDECVGKEINIASNSEISVGDLASLIVSLMNVEVVVESDGDRIRPEKSEVDRLFGSNERILSLTSWRQKVSIDQGLLRTIEWFSKSENLEHYKSHIYNV